MAISSHRKIFKLVSVINVILIQYTISLKLLELHVNQNVLCGVRPQLSCRWMLEDSEVLYSVKWYKDGKEFFRHVPREAEPQRKFILPGVDVEVSNSSGSHLILSPAVRETGGRYRCEVSGERPLFPTVSDHKDMIVVVPPEKGPIISGFRSKYEIGDRVEVICSSGPSYPQSHLAWYINGEPCTSMEPIYSDEDGMVTSRVDINFIVEERHFVNNVLKIKCLATIPPLYWKSNEEIALRGINTILHISNKTIAKPSKLHSGQANSVGIYTKTPIFLICLTVTYEVSMYF